MRVFLFCLVSFFFSLFTLPQDAFSETDSSDPFIKFKTRVKAVKNVSDGAAQWSSLAKAMSADPLFSSLGLDKLKYSGGNQLSYQGELTLGDAVLDLQGTLTFDPKPEDGAPVASLVSKTQSRVSGDLIDIGALHSTSASLEAVIYKEEGSYRIYARVIPDFTHYNRDPLPCLMLSKGKGGLDYTLLAGDLALRDLVPFAGQVPFYKQFSFESLSKTGQVYNIKGKVNGRSIAVTADNGQKTLLVTGKDLTAADFFPEASGAPVLNGFAFASFSQAGSSLAVSGTLNGRKLSVAGGTEKGSFVLTGEALRLADLVPGTENLPFLSKFALDSLTWSPSAITAAGRINGRSAAVLYDSNGHALTVTGDSLALRDFVPEAALAPVLNAFALSKLAKTQDGFAVYGTVNSVPVTVTRGPPAKTFSVTSSGLKLSDFLPAAAAVQPLDKFKFYSAVLSSSSTRVLGQVNNKNVSVEGNSAAGTFSVNGEGLVLTDFFPDAAGLPFLKQFAFDSFTYTPAAATASGKVNYKALFVKRNSGGAALAITGEDLKLEDFVPETAQLPFFSAFSLDGVRSSPAEFVVTGKVGSKAVTVDDHITSNIFTVTGTGLVLSDFVPTAGQMAYLNTFAFDRLTHTADGIDVAGLVNGKAVRVTRELSGNDFTVTGAGLKLSDFIPDAAKVSYLNRFAFESLKYSDAVTEVAGTINGKNISVQQDNAAKTFTVSGSAIQLADFVPEAAKVAYLQRFDFKRVQKRTGGVLVEGDVDGKALAVDYNTAAASFTVTGADLLLKDFVPQAAGMAYLDNFKFDRLGYAAGALEVAGKVNNKVVSVRKTPGAPDFSVAGDDLKLVDFIPQTAQVPCVNAFALDSVQRSDLDLGITGKVNGRPVSISDSFADKTLQMSGPGLSLPACIPLSLNIPFLRLFTFGSLFHWPDRLEVDGTVNGKDVKVVWIFAPNIVTVKGDSIRLGDLIPSAAKVSFLNNFAFLDLKYTQAETTVNGTVNAKGVSVVQDNAAKTFTVSGGGLKLGDFVPETAGIAYLQRFALNRVQERPDGVQVAGDVNGKTVTVETSRTAASFKVAGDSLLLADFIPEASGVAYLNNFAFRSLTGAAGKWTLEGTVNAKRVTIQKDPAVSGFTAAGDDLRLADLVPDASAVPYLNNFAFDSLAYVPGALTVRGKVGAKAVSVVKNNSEESFILTGDGIILADLVPAAAQVPFLGAFAFDRLKHTPGQLEVQGRVGKAAVTVKKDESQDSFSVIGEDLTLANFVPDASKIPFLNKFAFDSLVYTPRGLTVSGKIGDKAVSVVRSSADKTVKVTGDDLLVTDFVPEAAGVPFMKTFAFDYLVYSQTEVEVGGRINSRKVSVSKVFGQAGAFTATGEGLTLGDIVPEAAGLKAFDALALNKVAVSPEAVQVDGTLQGKAVTFVRTRGAKPVSTITADGLVLADIFQPLAGVPAINAVAVDKISLDGESVEVEARLNGSKVDVVAHAARDAGGYVSIFFNTLSAATFIPAAQGSVANDLSLERALFVIQPAGSPSRTVTANDLPGDLPKLVGWSGTDSMTLSEGVNVAAWVNVAKSGSLAAAFRAIGVPAGSLLIKGTVPPAAFKGLTGPAPAASLADADKQAMLAGLQLSVQLPLPSLPAVAGLVTVKGPVILSLGGDARSKSSLWAQVPAAISSSKPAGDLDVSAQFGLEIVGAGINEKLDALVNLDKGSRKGLTLLAVYEGAWKQPFGIQGLTLTDGGFEFSLEGAGAEAKSGLAFFATAEIGSRNVAVTADLKRADGKISLDYFELDGQFHPGDFPGGKNIPNGDKFELDQLKLSQNGVSAKTVVAGKPTDAYLFNAGTAGAPNWIFAVKQDNFNVTELLPAAKAVKPLAAMTIPKAALIISEKGLKSADRNSFGVIAKDLFNSVLGQSNAPVTVPDGIGVIASFNPSAMGLVGKGLSGLGVPDNSVITGAVTGVFDGGAPGVMLALTPDKGGEARGIPRKILNFKGGVPPSYFVQWSGQEIDVGLRIPIEVKAGKDLLVFSGDLELQFGEKGVGTKVLGTMDGIWRQPFGIRGLILRNVKLDVAIDEAGQVQFGLAGDQQFGNCADPKSSECTDADLAMSTKILLEDGLPDGVAFAGKVNQLGIKALAEIAETLLGTPGQISKLPAPFFQINNAKLAFATPGASDPQLGLVSQGFAFAGNFFFMNQELGPVQGAGGPGTGITIKGAIADIDLEVIKFKNNNVDIAINLNPRYAINSNVDLLGAVQAVKLDIKPPYFDFDLTEKLGAFGYADMTVRLDGFDLAKGTFDKSAGISMTGEFKSTLVPWMKGEVKKGIEELRDSAKAKFTADLQALNDAQKKVDDLNVKIQKLKAEDQKAKDRADDALNSAERRVNSLRDKHDHEDHEAHHCGSKWTHWACSPGWRVAAAATWAVYEVADGALAAAKKAVAAATNLDPRVAALIAERDIEHAGLSVAQAVMKVTEDMEDFVMKELEVILEKAVSDMPLEIDRAIMVGDLKDMINRNDPLVLDMQFKIAGDPMHEFFAVKVPDRSENVAFNAVSFALLPALGLDKLTEDALKKLSPQAARWIHSHIASELASAEEKVQQEVEGQEQKYKAVLATFDSGTAKYKKAFEDQSDEHLKLVEAMDVSDLMPDSLEYSNIYLAIGHSSLCLAVSKDGVSVVQLDCHDTDVEQWSTVKLKDDNAGYVELKNKGLCLKARNGDQKDNFEPLILAPCDASDRHEQWKIVSSDGFYDEIVNRFSQKCLHFNKENANPDTAYAVWSSCLGEDSQTFRDILDAEKPILHPVQAMVKAANGLCLDVAEEVENSLKFTPEKKTEKLYAHKCGDGSERFNYIEEINGDIRLVHTETGACVYPLEHSETLALRPCDRGSDMFWRLNSKSASTDLFLSPARDACMILPAPVNGSTRDVEAGIANCNIPNDGILLELIK